MGKTTVPKSRKLVDPIQSHRSTSHSAGIAIEKGNHSSAKPIDKSILHDEVRKKISNNLICHDNFHVWYFLPF